MKDKELERQLSLAMQGIAKRLDEDIERTTGVRIGFSLIVFTPGRASYISNASRKDCVAQIEKLLQAWKDGMDDIPAHEIN